MARKIQIPVYEKTLLDIGGMTVAQLEVLLNVVKVRLSQVKPRASRPKVVKKQEEKVS